MPVLVKPLRLDDLATRVSRLRIATPDRLPFTIDLAQTRTWDVVSGSDSYRGIWGSGPNDIHVAGFWAGVFGAIVFSLVSWLLSSLLLRDERVS